MHDLGMENTQTPEGTLIEQARRRSGASVRSVASLAGISEGRWRQVVKGYQAVTSDVSVPVKAPADTLAKMAEAVGLSSDDLADIGRTDAADAMLELFGPDEERPPRATFPADGIQNLILDKKGERSYERLARDCGYDIKNRALQAAATKVTKGFADPDTIRGLSRGLNVPVARVIRAYAVSLGLPVAEDEKGTLQIVGGAELPQSSQDLIIKMARELQHAYEAPVEHDYSDRYDLAAKQGDENIDPEEDQP